MKAIQDFFTDSVSRTWIQGHPCIDPNDPDVCAYSDGRGDHCAIGWCISDRVYTADLEPCAAAHDDIRHALYNSGYDLDEAHLPVLTDLQRAHDMWNLVENDCAELIHAGTPSLERRARSLAREYQRENRSFRDYWLAMTGIIAQRHDLNAWQPEEAAA